jgi:hypothetical protein
VKTGEQTHKFLLLQRGFWGETQKGMISSGLWLIDRSARRTP